MEIDEADIYNRSFSAHNAHIYFFAVLARNSLLIAVLPFVLFMSRQLKPVLIQFSSSDYLRSAPELFPVEHLALIGIYKKDGSRKILLTGRLQKSATSVTTRCY